MATSTIVPATPAVTTTRAPYLEWGPVFAGAIAAAAISFLLLTFASAIGLSLTSPWPNAGARLWVVALAVAWFAVVVQIGSFAAGGYLAGRMRSRWGESETEEGQFRDNAHGFMVWALGVLIGGLMLAWTAGAAVQTATQAVATVAGGAAAGAATNALRPTDYAVDLLLRGEANAAAAAPTATPAGQRAAGQRDDAALRAEAGRIFAASIRNQEFSCARSRLPGQHRARSHGPSGSRSSASRRYCNDRSTRSGNQGASAGGQCQESGGDCRTDRRGIALDRLRCSVLGGRSRRSPSGRGEDAGVLRTSLLVNRRSRQNQEGPGSPGPFL